MTAIAIILSSITIALTIVRSKGRKKTPVVNLTTLSLPTGGSDEKGLYRERSLETPLRSRLLYIEGIRKPR